MRLSFDLASVEMLLESSADIKYIQIYAVTIDIMTEILPMLL